VTTCWKTLCQACDGLLFPFAENAQSVYSSVSYLALLDMAQALTQGQGQSFWALHYGYMWKGAFGPGVHQVQKTDASTSSFLRTQTQQTV
jgi:hypothetical protein